VRSLSFSLARSYGVIVEDAPCELLAVTPDKLRRETSCRSAEYFSTPVPSADVTSLLSSLVPIGDMEAAADARDDDGRSPEILFCRQYEDDSSPILDVSDVDEVRRSAARPPELPLQPHV
jgi:hypothetical protein